MTSFIVDVDSFQKSGKVRFSMVGQLSVRRVKVRGYHISYFRKHRFFDLLLSETDDRIPPRVGSLEPSGISRFMSA